jgi:hypothetical protein
VNERSLVKEGVAGGDPAKKTKEANLFVITDAEALK